MTSWESVTFDVPDRLWKLFESIETQATALNADVSLLLAVASMALVT